MKKLSLLSLIILFLSVMSSCSEEEVPANNGGDSLSNADIRNMLESSTWSISYMNDSGSDETVEFTNCIFKFQNDGVIEASGASSAEGTWVLDNDSGLNINFTTNAEFIDHLNERWDIIAVTEDEISLEHVSGGNGGTDNLYFKKN